jgi:2-polyprenyl-3-methyl-5-hydroxy-6-metoxy-1,4-benzoquinol methylase
MIPHGMISRDDRAIDCFYYPEVFNNVADLEHAKRLTVSREGDLTSETRWDIETKFTIDLLFSFVTLDETFLVLDYGCGVGRLSKPLIKQFDCAVVGVDMSAKMRSLATQYVDQPCFEPCSPDGLRIPSIMEFDCAIAAWVLQHCAAPSMDIELIASVIKPKAHLLVLGTLVRKIPIRTLADSTLCWMDDGLDVQELTLKHFDLIEQGVFPTELAQLNDGNYWAMYQRK